MKGAEPLGSVKLCVPHDWFDLLADGADREAARSRCAEIVRRTYPTASEDRRNEFVNALMAWHETLLGSGVLVYGIVSAPMPDDPATAANWQVFAGVVDVPAASTEVDLGALLAQAYGARAEGPTYQESFTTDMGIGLGFITQPVIRVAGDQDALSQAQIGLVGALSCPPGGERGLLVLGISLTPEHVWELAGLVAAIAGRSVFEEDPDRLSTAAEERK
jgi:hypothetical protein